MSSDRILTNAGVAVLGVLTVMACIASGYFWSWIFRCLMGG